MEIKLKKIHEWIEFLTRVKHSKFVGKFLVFLSYMMVRKWFMLSVLKIICFYIFSRDSVLKISSMVNLITKQKTGFELSYKSSFTKISKWNQTSELFFFTVLRRIFGVYKHFGFAKVKIHFALYQVRNDNSNSKEQSLKVIKESCV